MRNQDSQGQTFVDLDPWQQLEGEWIKKRPSHRWATTQPSDALALGQPGSTFAISHRFINFLQSNFYDVEDQRKNNYDCSPHGNMGELLKLLTDSYVTIGFQPI